MVLEKQRNFSITPEEMIGFLEWGLGGSGGASFDGLVKSIFSPKEITAISFNINKLTLRALFTP